MKIEKFESRISQELLLNIEDRIEVRVDGYGTEGYTVKVETIDEEWAEAAKIANETPGFWGKGLIWASPNTIAHLVWDYLTSQ